MNTASAGHLIGNLAGFMACWPFIMRAKYRRLWLCTLPLSLPLWLLGVIAAVPLAIASITMLVVSDMLQDDPIDK